MKKNAIAVIGLGRFGMPLAKKLAEAGKEVIGVDMDEERVKEFREFSEYAFVAKKLSKEVLIEIGIQNCDLVAVCIGSKVETSILVTLNVLNLGVPVISKATSAEQGEVLAKLGATVVYPERDMALRIAKRILRKNLVDFLPIGKDIEIIEIEVSDRMVGQDDRRYGSAQTLFAECHRDPSRRTDRDRCPAGLPPVPWRYDHRDRKGRKRDAFR